MPSNNVRGNEHTLRVALLANVAFSLVCTLGLLLFPATIAGWLGDVPPVSCTVLGAVLLPFVLGAYWIQHNLPASKEWARGIFIADAAWVALTPVVLWLFSPYLSTVGFWLVVDVALVVGALAFWEWRGLQRLSNGAPAQT